MSGGDEQAPSFGVPNARPPTPPRISTTAVSASPLLVTPKRRNSGQFEEATTGWTPRFAEDYSVFNSTSVNLKGSVVGAAAANLDHSAPLSPRERGRPLSAEGVAREIATHANHFSLDPEKLPPVDVARRLSSCPDPLSTKYEGTYTAASGSDLKPRPSWSQQSKRSSETYQPSASSSVTAGREAPAQNTQTATPPPSSRGGRKLAPRPSEPENMQSHHQGFGGQHQPDPSSAQTPQQPQLNAAFVSGSPEDVFACYPVGPATTSPGAGARPFWGMSMDANGMGIDVGGLSATGTEPFQTTPTQDPSSRLMNSSNWGRADQMYQQSGMMGQPQPQSQGQNIQQNQGARRERRLAPKTAQMSTPKADQSFGFFQMSMDDPFGTSPGGVDPGLVFSQLPSTSPLKVDTMSMSLSMSMEPSPQRPTSSAPSNIPQGMTSMDMESTVSETHRPTNDIRRTGSTGGRSQRKQLDRASALLSPTKNSAGRLGLSRSFSESARSSKRMVGGGRSALPALAPARPVTVHQPSLPPPLASRESQSQSQGGGGGTRPTGRRSPLKRQHRMSSLSSIPENTTNTHHHQRLRSASSRTSVKFVIDGNGRARTETVMDEDEPEPALLPLSSSQQLNHRNSWGGFSISPDDDGGYPSSSDDEPIIIPSRTSSFNFPEPPKNAGLAASRPRPDIFASRAPPQNRLRSNSDRQSYSSASFYRRSSRMDLDTSMTDPMDMDDQPQQQQQQQAAPPPPRPSTGSSLGDAAAELRKVMQAGSSTSKQPSNAQPQALGNGTGAGSGHRQRFTPGQRSSSSTISEASLPTPSPTQSQNQAQIRCVCNRPDMEVDGAAFLVKCDSCEYLLHGHCVDVPAAQDVPHVYICAFCANTPNMRGGRMRYTGRNNSTGGLGGDDGGMMGPRVSASVIASSPLAHKSFRSFR